MRRSVPALFLALLPVCFLPGLPWDSPDDWENPADTLTEAVIGVAEFRFNASEARTAFLGGNVARLFREKLSEISIHELNEEEGGQYALGIIAAEREKILRRIEELRASRDALFFPGTALRDSSRGESLTGDIEKEQEKLRRINALAPSEITLIREKKLRLLEPAGTAAAELLPPVQNPQQAARDAKVDYLLWGSIREEVAGLISITASLYSARAKSALFSGFATGTVDEMESLVDRLFTSLAEAVAGRPWATLEIRTDPKNALVFVDGSLRGIGNVKLPYIRPGTYRVSIYADGYDTLEKEILLEARSRQNLSLDLAPAPLPEVTLETFPSGADVYLGAMKQGVTPLQLPLGATPDILSMSQEGHKTIVFPSTAAGIAETHILPRDIISWEERIETKRAGFYRAWGFFILSLPLPLMLYGAYQNQSFNFIQYTRSSGFDIDRARGMEKKGKILYYAYFGSLFLSGSLFVNTIQKLLDYIRTGEESQKYPDSR
jgi:hypothetical protein